MRAPFPGLPAERIPPLSWQSTDYVCPMAWWGWIHLLCVVVDTKLWIDALLSVELHCRRNTPQETNTHTTDVAIYCEFVQYITVNGLRVRGGEKGFHFIEVVKVAGHVCGKDHVNEQTSHFSEVFRVQAL